MPVSVTRSAPYFSCRPENPWLTSPSWPTSSPKATRLRDAPERGVEAGVQDLEAVDQRRVVARRRPPPVRPRAASASAGGVEVGAVALLVLEPVRLRSSARARRARATGSPRVAIRISCAEVCRLRRRSGCMAIAESGPATRSRRDRARSSATRPASAVKTSLVARGSPPGRRPRRAAAPRAPPCAASCSIASSSLAPAIPSASIQSRIRRRPSNSSSQRQALRRLVALVAARGRVPLRLGQLGDVDDRRHVLAAHPLGGGRGRSRRAPGSPSRARGRGRSPRACPAGAGSRRASRRGRPWRSGARWAPRCRSRRPRSTAAPRRRSTPMALTASQNCPSAQSGVADRAEGDLVAVAREVAEAARARAARGRAARRSRARPGAASGRRWATRRRRVERAP